MKIATKSLAVLLIVTMLTLSSGSHASAKPSRSGSLVPRNINRLQRIQNRHDKKHELRASVLGISPDELKQELKNHNFDQILKRHGFKTRLDFQKAVVGKLKDELKRRGWSDRKIDKFLQKRSHRLVEKRS